MKKLLTMCTALLLAAFPLHAIQKLSLQSITSGELAPAYVSGINPIHGTSRYASIENDGKQIVCRSFKSGRLLEVLFDLSTLKSSPFESFDGYIMSPDGQKLLIRTNTKAIYRRSYTAIFYLYDIRSKTLRPLSNGGPQQVPTWSPDSRKVAFVRQNNIFITDGITEKQITEDGKFGHIINGIPDWVNEEEFSSNNSMAWSEDSKYLSWVKYDESNVLTYSLQMFKGMAPELNENADYPHDYSYKYPKAGQENAKVSVWGYELNNGKTFQLSVPTPADGYIPRIKSARQGSGFIVYTMNRHQNLLNLYLVHPQFASSNAEDRGQVQQILEEKSDKYIKEEAMEGILIGKERMIVPSDRDGYMHLYEYDKFGHLLRQVERGAYDVLSICGFDEKKGDIYYIAAIRSPHDRQVCVTHANGKTEYLTSSDGDHSAVFSGDFQYFIHVWSDYDHPYVFTLCDRHGQAINTLEDNATLKTKVENYGWSKKQTFSFTTSDSVRLDGWMVLPPHFNVDKRYPVIMFQYSGPGSQQVVNSWSSGSMGQGGAFDMYLAQLGYIVVCVDGRGTGGRGAEFEKCTYLRLGELEARDQVATAHYLATLPYVDAARIGIWGWSFGGFNTLMSMSEGHNVFKAGVAVAPPTAWKYYDTIYTERYMRTPKENPEGYNINPITKAAALQGSLLICHGVADDNVHPQNTFEYAEALVEADKDFKEIYYTNRNHSIRGGNSRNHLLRQITQWFEEYLK